MQPIKNNAPIDNNQNGNSIKNIIFRIKSVFFRKFAKIKKFFSNKNYINYKIPRSPAVNDPKIKRSADNELHRIIPEHIGLVEDIEAKKVKDLYHDKKRSTDNENIQLKPKKEDFTLGAGSFGEVKLAALNSKSPTKKISPLLVRKKFIDMPASKITAQKEAIKEHEKNVKYGNYSIADFNNKAIISKYKGENFRKLIDSSFKKSNDTHAKPLSNKVKEHFCRELLENVKKLHDQGILHQDIKPENIIVDAKGKLSIIDLSGATQHSSKKENYNYKHKLGPYSVLYSAPEIIKHKEDGLTQYYDSWSVGATIYELYTGEILTKSCFYIEEDGHPSFERRDIALAKDKELRRIKYRKDIPENIKKLLYGLLKTKPEDRLKVSEALELLDHNELNISTISDLQLNVMHDKKFKSIVDLELSLIEAEKNSNYDEIVKLSAKIDNEKLSLTQLQNEINKRKQN